MPSGSNAALIRRHERELGRILELEEVAALLGADAVLARDGAAERGAAVKTLRSTCSSALGVRLEHREVDVAVAGVAAADDDRAAVLRDHGHLREKLGDLRPRARRCR